jgi:hypothetical protein
MVSRFRNPVQPFPEWERRLYHLSRPVTGEDVEAILNGQEEYVREVGSDRVLSIHKFGLVEINVIVGVPEIEVWFSPEQRVWTSEYLDALLSTRF